MVALLQPLGPGKQIPVDRAVVLIGRSPECDCVLDVSTKISRLHCALIQVDNTFFIRDLGSMNGVWVNGDRVENERQLKNQDSVAVGDVQFQFLENAQLAKPTPGQPASPPPRPDQKRALPKLIQEQSQSLSEEIGVRDLGNDSDDVILVDDVEVVDEVEVVDDVEVVEEFDDLDFLDDAPRRPKRRR